MGSWYGAMVLSHMLVCQYATASRGTLRAIVSYSCPACAGRRADSLIARGRPDGGRWRLQLHICSAAATFREKYHICYRCLLLKGGESQGGGQLERHGQLGQPGSVQDSPRQPGRLAAGRAKEGNQVLYYSILLYHIILYYMISYYII